MEPGDVLDGIDLAAWIADRLNGEWRELNLTTADSHLETATAVFADGRRYEITVTRIDDTALTL